MSGNHTGKIEVRVARREDLEVLALQLRKSDVDEIAAATGLAPFDGLIECMRASQQTYYATFDGQPLALFGLCIDVDAPLVGGPWMLGTVRVSDCPVSFMKLSHEWVGRFLEEVHCLRNFVLAQSHTSIAYLARLGFLFEAPVTLGPAGALFLPFYKHANEGESLCV